LKKSDLATEGPVNGRGLFRAGSPLDNECAVAERLGGQLAEVARLKLSQPALADMDARKKSPAASQGFHEILT